MVAKTATQNIFNNLKRCKMFHQSVAGASISNIHVVCVS